MMELFEIQDAVEKEYKSICNCGLDPPRAKDGFFDTSKGSS